MKNNPMMNCEFLHSVCKDSCKIGKNRSPPFSESYGRSHPDFVSSCLDVMLRGIDDDYLAQKGLYTTTDFPLTISDTSKLEDLGPMSNESKSVDPRETAREDALDSAKINHSNSANHCFLDDSSFLNQFALGVEDFRPLNFQMAELDFILNSQIPGFASDLVFSSMVMEDSFRLPSLEEMTDGQLAVVDFKGLGSEETDLFIRDSLNVSYMEASSLPTLLYPEANRKRVTLVLDLDETLIHSTTRPCSDADFSFRIPINKEEKTMYVRRRPFLRAFLERVSELFEIILFTASQASYAKLLLDHLGPEGKIFSRHAFRDSCVLADGIFTKDLKVLGVDLAKVAIVDNTPEVYRWQVNNGIPIKSWYDDPSDTELTRLLPFLETLVDVDDVRPLIKQKFSGKGQR